MIQINNISLFYPFLMSLLHRLFAINLIMMRHYYLSPIQLIKPIIIKLDIILANCFNKWPWIAISPKTGIKTVIWVKELL